MAASGSRNYTLLAIGLLLLAGPTAWSAGEAKESGGEKLWVYVGTYTGKTSKGIYRFEFDPATGKLGAGLLAGESVNPSFLAIHPSRRFLYAVNEVNDFHGKKTGAVSAYAIAPKTGKLTLLNQQPSGGGSPCYIVTDRAGKHVLVANYGGGSVTVLPIQSDGKLGTFTAFVQHIGFSVNKQRQEGPHAHSINLDPANHFAYACDLGLDMIMIYRYDADKGTLKPNNPANVRVAPGSGPRHFAFHPNGKYAYVINEMKSTVTAFQYDPKNGDLKTLQTISTLPRGFRGNSSGAEVQVHPSGKFLYGSNRGHDSIAVFRIDPNTGKLTAAGYQRHQIKTPRGFGIDPKGTNMIVGNQDGNSLVVFRIDPKTGKLTPTGSSVEVGMPVCVKMTVPLP